MPLEKSILSREDMKNLLTERYSLHFLESSRLSHGTANCFRMRCEEGEFFLKEYQSRFTPGDVDSEGELVSYLISRGFPTAGFIKTVDGRYQTEYRGHVIALQEFVEGETYMNDLPHELLPESARCLGKLHNCLRGYPLRTEMTPEWAEKYSVEEASGKCDKLLTALEANRSVPDYDRIRSDLLYKKELNILLDGMKSYYKEITYTPSHGDYTACQLICSGSKIKAVIDFSSAACIPAVWEIMRSYMQSSGACMGGSPLNIEDFVSYVREYGRFAKLTERDLESMPYVYLFQLARSCYGYKEYLLTEAENRDKLLQFAFWRTEICREVYGRLRELSDALM